MEGHLNAHGHSHREGDHTADDIHRVIRLLPEGVEVRVGAEVEGDGDRRRGFGPNRRVVVVAGILVQAVASMLTAEAIVAGPTTVYEIVFGAVKCPVVLSHYVIVAPADVHVHQLFGRGSHLSRT